MPRILYNSETPGYDDFEAYDDDYDDYSEYDDEIRYLEQFASSGSALRAATPTNPRNLPCPTCQRPNKLTPEDVALGYQCDRCADQVERGY